MSRPYRVVTFNRFQVNQTADRQSLLIALTLINHPVDMLSQDFPGLLNNRLITVLKLLVDGQGTFDGGGRDDLFDRGGYWRNMRRQRVLYRISRSVFERHAYLPCLIAGGCLGAVQLPRQDT